MIEELVMIDDISLEHKVSEILMDNDYEPMFFDGTCIHAFWEEDYGVPFGHNWGTSKWNINQFKSEFDIPIDFELIIDLPSEEEYEEQERKWNEGECDGYVDCLQ